MLSHANLWLAAQTQWRPIWALTACRIARWRCMPLSFDAGQNQLLSSWYAGAMRRPARLSGPGRRGEGGRSGMTITTWAGVPPLWVQLAEADVAA